MKVKDTEHDNDVQHKQIFKHRNTYAPSPRSGTVQHSRSGHRNTVHVAGGPHTNHYAQQRNAFPPKNENNHAPRSPRTSFTDRNTPQGERYAKYRKSRSALSPSQTHVQPSPRGIPSATPEPNAVGQTQRSKLTVLEHFGYTVGKSIGSGSYATVKQAYCDKHGDVAIKVISKRRAPKDYIDKFLPREIACVKDLRHEYIVCFHQSIETTNRMYLVMELAPGGDLLGEVRKKRRILEKQAGVWFYQMVEGMAHCHRKGIAHRDLKCENLLLDKNRNIKITDFGFARNDLPIDPETNNPTLSRTFCGSYAYAPPEILTGTPYDPFQADIWSMGVVCYTMMYGRLPFDDTNHKLLLRQVINGIKIPPAKKDWVSDEGILLMSKILVRAKHRLLIDEIRNDPWVLKYAKPQEPREGDYANKSAGDKHNILKNNPWISTENEGEPMQGDDHQRQFK